MDQNHAETLALNCLQYLAEGPDRLGRFLASSGAGPDDLKAGVGNPVFLGGVLDYVLADETLIFMIAESTGQNADSFLRARRALPGSHD